MVIDKVEYLWKDFESKIRSFIYIWPYLLVTIPLAIVINLSGASKYINKALSKKPLVSGLITLGMNHGAVLALPIAGPVTTLPAMMAVWGIVKPKVFFMFLAFGLTGSVLFGYLYNLVY